MRTRIGRITGEALQRWALLLAAGVQALWLLAMAIPGGG